MLTAKDMPKGPKGQKRPADVIGNAVHVMRVLTGEADDGAVLLEEGGSDGGGVHTTGHGNGDEAGSGFGGGCRGKRIELELRGQTASSLA